MTDYPHCSNCGLPIEDRVDIRDHHGETWCPVCVGEFGLGRNAIEILKARCDRLEREGRLPDGVSRSDMEDVFEDENVEPDV